MTFCGWEISKYNSNTAIKATEMDLVDENYKKEFNKNKIEKNNCIQIKFPDTADKRH